jgi:MoxR-like ATPase
MEDYSALRQPEKVIARLISQIEHRILGKRDAIRKLVIAVLAGGHVLIEDVPGTGKTVLVKTLAQSIGCSFRRIQFTPDLLPSDITGATIYNQRTGEFEFRHGPLASAHLLLADELNRASPRTQAALLEAMEERRITVDGVGYDLPSPFMVLATQNPLEHEGTYPLPEAQLDRFMMRIRLGYPDAEAETRMLEQELNMAKTSFFETRPVLSRDTLLQLRRLAAEVHVDESIKRYMVELAGATRAHPDLRNGVSPRATIALMKAAQASALMAGRNYVIPDDVKPLVSHVFGHRLAVSDDAGAGLAAADGTRAVEKVLASIVSRLPVPAASAAPFVTARVSLFGKTGFWT